MTDPPGAGHGLGGDRADPWGNFGDEDSTIVDLTDGAPPVEASSSFQPLGMMGQMENSSASAATIPGAAPALQLRLSSGPPPDGSHPVDTDTPMGLPRRAEPTGVPPNQTLADFANLIDAAEMPSQGAHNTGLFGSNAMHRSITAAIPPTPRPMEWVMDKLDSCNIQEYIDTGVDRTRLQGDLTYAEICVCLVSNELNLRDGQGNGRPLFTLSSAPAIASGTTATGSVPGPADPFNRTMAQRVTQGLFDRPEALWSAKPPLQASIDFDARIVVVPTGGPPDTFLIIEGRNAYFPMETPVFWPAELITREIDWAQYILEQYTRVVDSVAGLAALQQQPATPPPPAAAATQPSATTATQPATAISQASNPRRRAYTARLPFAGRIARPVGRRSPRSTAVNSRARYVRRRPRMRNDQATRHGSSVNHRQSAPGSSQPTHSPPSRRAPGSYPTGGAVPTVHLAGQPTAPAGPQDGTATSTPSMEHGNQPDIEQNLLSPQLNMDQTATNGAN